MSSDQEQEGGSPRHSGTPPLSLLWRAPLFQGASAFPKVRGRPRFSPESVSGKWSRRDAFCLLGYNRGL